MFVFQTYSRNQLCKKSANRFARCGSAGTYLKIKGHQVNGTGSFYAQIKPALNLNESRHAKLNDSDILCTPNVGSSLPYNHRRGWSCTIVELLSFQVALSVWVNLTRLALSKDAFHQAPTLTLIDPRIAISTRTVTFLRIKRQRGRWIYPALSIPDLYRLYDNISCQNISTLSPRWCWPSAWRPSPLSRLFSCQHVSSSPSRLVRYNWYVSLHDHKRQISNASDIFTFYSLNSMRTNVRKILLIFFLLEGFC